MLDRDWQRVENGQTNALARVCDFQQAVNDLAHLRENLKGHGILSLQVDYSDELAEAEIQVLQDRLAARLNIKKEGK